MSLADELTNHQKLILADLDAVHDYFVNTKADWYIVLQHFDRGEQMTIANPSTGNVMTEKVISEMADYYITEYLTASTFQQFVAIFEDFLFGVMRFWLLAYPRRLAKKQLPFSVVLDAAELDDVKLEAANRELNELNYKKPREWFAYLYDMVKLGCPTADEIDRLAEIKATRDVYAHGRGIASRIYEEKAGMQKRCNAGERLEIAEPYHQASWALIKKVVADLSSAAIAKA